MMEDDTAIAVHTWATQEMHFSPQGHHVNTRIPAPDDFRDVCRGSLVDVWKFVVKRVHSAQNVKKIQGNLALHSKAKHIPYKVRYKSDENYSEEHAALQDAHADLTKQLTKHLSDLAHLDSELHRLHKDITTAESSYQAGVHSAQDVRRKAALLKTFSKSCAEQASQYDECTNRIKGKVSKLSGQSRTETQTEVYYSRDNREEGADGTGLESSSCRRVRESCEAIGSFLHDVLRGHFGDDKSALQHRRHQMWSHVEDILSQFSVSQIVQSLVINSQETTMSLKERTDKINIRTDAENLRFKYEKTGALSDVSSPPSLLQTELRLQEEYQGAHIHRFFMTLKSRTAAHKNQQQFPTYTEKLLTAINKSYKHGSSQHTLVRQLVNVQLALAEGRAAKQCFTDEAHRLTQLIRHGQKDQEALITRYERITEFKELSTKNQNLIHILVNQNTNGDSRLLAQQGEIKKYISASLGDHESAITSLVSDLSGRVRTEVDMFTGLMFPYLMHTWLDEETKMAVLDLSLHQHRRPESTMAGEAIHKVLTNLNLSPFMAPELILPKCVEMKRELEQLEMLLRSHDVMSHRLFSVQGHTADVNEYIAGVSELCERVKEHDRKQIGKMLPLLQKRVNMVTDSLSSCIDTKNLLQAWWEQPAQSAVPWVKVDHLNLEQWKGKCNVIVTRLRQLQLQRDSKR